MATDTVAIPHRIAVVPKEEAEGQLTPCGILKAAQGAAEEPVNFGLAVVKHVKLARLLTEGTPKCFAAGTAVFPTAAQVHHPTPFGHHRGHLYDLAHWLSFCVVHSWEGVGVRGAVAFACVGGFCVESAYVRWRGKPKRDLP